MTYKLGLEHLITQRIVIRRNEIIEASLHRAIIDCPQGHRVELKMRPPIHRRAGSIHVTEHPLPIPGYVKNETMEEELDWQDKKLEAEQIIIGMFGSIEASNKRSLELRV